MSTLTTGALIKDGQVSQFGYKIVLVKQGGGRVSLNTYVRSFRIFESIFTKFTYMEGLILDGMNITQRFGFQPGDKFEVEIYKDPSDSPPIERLVKSFIIEELGGQNRPDGNKAANYTFRAVSELGHKGLNARVKRSYRGKASAIVDKINSTFLNKNLLFEKTPSYGDIRYVTTDNKSVFDVIEDISKHCISASNPKDGNYLFYEARDKCFFKALKHIRATGVDHKYKLVANKNRAEQTEDNLFRIDTFVHHESIDQRKNYLNGTLNNVVRSFDFITREVKDTDYAILSDSRHGNLFGDNLLMEPEEVNFFRADLGDAGPSVFLRCSQKSYKDSEKDSSEELLSKIRPYAVGQMGLLNQTRLTVSVLGNPKILPGDVIEIEMAQASGDSTIEEKDFVLGGKFLVGTVVHAITDSDDYSLIIDLYKDSYERDISSFRKDINSLGLNELGD